MVVLNQTLFNITFNWDRAKFEASRHQCRVARKRIEMSINVQYEKQMRGVFSQNIHIEQSINASDDHLARYHDKLRVLENMIELTSQSLIVYFEKRMEHVRAIVSEHCQIIQQVIQEEAEHWKEIHAVLDQNLLNPGDIRSRNNYPKTVQKSPASNIQAIDEVDEEEAAAATQMSKLVNGKTLTPLLTQMIRKSRFESKPSPALPPSGKNIDLPMSRENSIPRKHERSSFHILPLSTTRQPLKLVDTTFVVKPEEANLYGNLPYSMHDDANGTYRAVNPHFPPDQLICAGEGSFLDVPPQLPARLCFSPTILHDATVLPDNRADPTSSSSSSSSVASPAGNTTQRTQEDLRRFGQTFLLDTIKKESIASNQINFVRPAIPDEDEEVVFIVHVQPTSATHQEPVPVKSRTRVKRKSKAKSVVISTRKTRSATKDVLERAAATTASAPPMEKPPETKRKTRKRKPSKSIDRAEASTDEENDRLTGTLEQKRKTKKRKKSNADQRDDPVLEEETKPAAPTRSRQTQSKRKTRSKGHDEDPRETTNRRKTRQRTKIEEQEQEEEDQEDKRKKSKVKKKTDNEPTKTKKKKSRKTEDESEQTKQHNTRLSAKRNYRSTRAR